MDLGWRVSLVCAWGTSSSVGSAACSGLRWVALLCSGTTSWVTVQADLIAEGLLGLQRNTSASLLSSELLGVGHHRQRRRKLWRGWFHLDGSVFRWMAVQCSDQFVVVGWRWSVCLCWVVARVDVPIRSARLVFFLWVGVFRCMLMSQSNRPKLFLFTFVQSGLYLLFNIIGSSLAWFVSKKIESYMCYMFCPS